MARNFRALVAVGLLALFTTGAAAQSGCGGQGASGAVCGNQAASTGLPSLGTVTGLLDRAMGSSQGRVLQRGAGGWAASPNPSLGVNGSVGGAITLNGSSSGSVTLRVPAAAGGTVFQFPASNGTAGYVLTTDGAGNTSWLNNAAGGTVTSVGLSMPGIFSVSGSPVTLTGTLTATLATQAANLVWAGPTTGAAAAPTFRALVGADLPNPSASTLGGVQSFAAVSSQWIRQISTSGVPTASQPNFTDIAGTASAAQCPLPGASSIGCVQSFALQASRWISSISTSGVPSATQPAFTDISGSIVPAQLPSIGNNTILGNISGGTAIPSGITASNILDILGSTQGQVLYRNASTWVSLAPGTSGQVLTTGGAAANPAWATVTGTGTVTSVATNNGLTGGTITTTGTIGLDAIANGTLLANVSGISQHPTATAPTAILDIVGSTQGNILYRAAGNWTVLAPGTNGQVLTMGASTPAWGSAGTVSNATIAAGTNISVSGTCNISTTGTCTITNNGVRTIAGNTGAFTLGVGLTNSVNDLRVSLSTTANSLASNVSLNNTGLYFDGPSAAQGTSGTWFASGAVTVQDTAGAAQIRCKLWDGTTVIASTTQFTPAASAPVSIHLSGVLASPAANIRISCDDITSTNGQILFNNSSNSKDSTVSVFRIQ